jgi:hypothetical protein
MRELSSPKANLKGWNLKPLLYFAKQRDTKEEHKEALEIQQGQDKHFEISNLRNVPKQHWKGEYTFSKIGNILSIVEGAAGSFLGIASLGGILGGWNSTAGLIFSSAGFSTHPEIKPISINKLTKIGIAFFIFSIVLSH